MSASVSLAGACLAADVDRVRELLELEDASVFVVRPDVSAAALPDHLEDFASRVYVYVQLAMRKAGKGSKRKDDLAQVLHILDGREALEARVLACCERNEQESVLRRVSLHGFDFSIHGLRDRQD